MNVSVLDMVAGVYTVNPASPTQTPAVTGIFNWNAGGSGSQAGTAADNKHNQGQHHE